MGVELKLNSIKIYNNGTPVVIDAFRGEKGEKGAKGDPGRDGTMWNPTDAEKQEMAQSILEHSENAISSLKKEIAEISDNLWVDGSDNDIFVDKTFNAGTYFANGRYYTGDNYKDFNASNYIEVQPSKEYDITPYRRISISNSCELDANKTQTGKVQYIVTDAEKQICRITTSANAKYIVLVGDMSVSQNYDGIYIVPAGEEHKITDGHLNVEAIENGSIEEEKLGDAIKRKIDSTVRPDIGTIVRDVFTDKTPIKSTNINSSNGVENTNANFVACGFQEVKAETSYHVMRDSFKRSLVGNVAFYDADKKYISGQGSNWTNWTTPANAKYVRFSAYIDHYNQDTFTFDGVMVVEGTTAKAPNEKPCIENARTSDLLGKKWIAIGDSITEVNERTDLHYHDYIASKYAMDVVNMGVGGTGYINRKNVGKAFYQRCNSIDTDADIITVFGGVNDCTLATEPIGNVTDTGTDTWCGCVNTLIDTIRSQYVYAPLGIISPLPCAWTSAESSHPNQLPSDTECNMSVFVEKLNTICALKGIPFLDLFHTSNMRPENAEFNKKYYSCWSNPNGDGLHPNNDGHKLFYRKIEQFIETLIN